MKADILFDKTEFVLRLADKEASTMNIRADQLTTVTFQPTMQKKMFKSVESEVMILKMKGGAAPGATADGLPVLKEAFESKEKGSWDKAKKQMLKFAKDNNVTVHEEKDMWVQPSE